MKTNLLQISLPEKEWEIIIIALADRPYIEVFSILEKLKPQLKQQKEFNQKNLIKKHSVLKTPCPSYKAPKPSKKSQKT